MGWQAARSGERPAEIVAWEIDTALAKYGIDRGVEYTRSPGIGEMADYIAFFRGFLCLNRDPDVARSLGIALNQPIGYYPRRSFNLWNTRYFVVPAYPANWVNEQRAYASLGYRSERLYPPPESLNGQERHRRWVSDRDFQVLRNPQAFPRAWIVHDARAVPTIGGTSRVDRRRLLDEMTYSEDLWREAPLRVFDPRAVAWFDDVDLRELAPYLRGQPPGRDETVKVAYPDPQRVELEARLDAPGIVVLCDAYYPGWELTIDGRPAPIYRINLAMRGAAVDAGLHRLVYSYRPRSFRVGLLVSIAGLAALVLFAITCKARPVVEAVVESGRPDERAR
jgi:Bacterial membrane protein YfhO